jgi:hypothetical protein
VERERNLTVLVSAGGWDQVTPDPKLGSTQSFVFAAHLSFDGLGAGAVVTNVSSAPRLEMQLDLFERNTPVSLAGLVNFTITTSFTKLSFRMWHWPWNVRHDPHRRVEVRVGIAPRITNVVSATTDAGGGMTEFTMNNVEGGEWERVKIRLVDVVEVDGLVVRQISVGNGTGEVAAVKFSVDEAKSTLVLSFGYFNSTLSYDPGTRMCLPFTVTGTNACTDVGVLLGATRGESSSSTTWIVAVAVAVPVATGLAVLLVVVSSVVLYLRHKRARHAIEQKLRRAMHNGEL